MKPNRLEIHNTSPCSGEVLCIGLSFIKGKQSFRRMTGTHVMFLIERMNTCSTLMGGLGCGPKALTFTFEHMSNIFKTKLAIWHFFWTRLIFSRKIVNGTTCKGSCIVGWNNDILKYYFMIIYALVPDLSH